MLARVEHAEGIVVVAGNGNQLVIRQSCGRQPDKEPMLCNSWCNDVAMKRRKGSAHGRSRLGVYPPSFTIDRSAVVLALGINLLLDPSEWRLVECSLALWHLDTEVDNGHVARAAGDVHAIDPRLDDVAVRSPVRVDWSGQHLPGYLGGDIELAAFGVAHKGDPGILGEALGFGQVCRCGQVGVDRRDGLAVQCTRRFLPIVVADEGDTHGSAIESPRLV